MKGSLARLNRSPSNSTQHHVQHNSPQMHIYGNHPLALKLVLKSKISNNILDSVLQRLLRCLCLLVFVSDVLNFLNVDKSGIMSSKLG